MLIQILYELLWMQESNNVQCQVTVYETQIKTNVVLYVPVLFPVPNLAEMKNS